MGLGAGAVLLAGVVLFMALVAFSPLETGPMEAGSLDYCNESVKCTFTSVGEGSALERYAVRTVNLGRNVLVACVGEGLYEGPGFVPESDCTCNTETNKCVMIPRGVPRVPE